MDKYITGGEGMSEKQVEKKIKYKIVENHSFVLNNYMYMGHYESGRKIGTKLAVFVMTVSFIVGLLINKVEFDSCMVCFALWSYLSGIKLMRMIYKHKKTGYFGSANEVRFNYYTYRNYTIVIMIMQRFFELYFPFVLPFFFENIHLRIWIPLLFIFVNCKIKHAYNFVENKKWNITKRALFPHLMFYMLGLLLSSQKLCTVTVYDNSIILLFFLLAGVWYIKHNRGFKSIKDTYNHSMEKKIDEFDIGSMAESFGFKMKKPLRFEPRDLTKEEKAKIDKIEYERYLAKERRLAEIKKEWRDEHDRQEQLKKERLEKERLKNLERQIAQGKLKNVSEEDAIKLRKMDSEKYYVDISDSVKVDRTKVSR